MMNRVISWRFVSLWTVLVSVTGAVVVSDVTGQPLRKVGSMEGDILFAGLFPVHDPGTSSNLCGDVVNIERGIHRLEAMYYAIDEINKNLTILRNVTVGAEIHDTCGQDTVALEGAVTSVMSRVNRAVSNCQGTSAKQKLVAGVIGASSSSVSAQVANLLRLFQLPQISYASTSADLDDRRRFKYFLRTVPSDTQQVQGLLNVIARFGWQSVFVVYSEGSYGETAFDNFVMNALFRDVCIVESFKLTRDTNVSQVVEALLRHETTSVVVMFCQTYHIASLLDASALLTRVGRFLWLASDSWGTRSQFISETSRPYAEGAITFTIRTKPLPAFERYFAALHPCNNSRNPWFREYWGTANNVSIGGNLSCPPLPDFVRQRNITFDDKVPYVVDAVYALAHAFDKLYRKHCPLQRGICYELGHADGEELLDILQNITFHGSFGPTSFNENGNANHGYDILVLRRGIYHKIGSWNGSLQLIDLPGLVTPIDSFCSSKCGLGFMRTPRRHGPPCCYRCVECSKHEYLEGLAKCSPCGSGQTPNATRNGCQALPVRRLSRKWLIIVTSFASVGIALTLVVMLIFICNNDTTVVKASARELSYPLLLGVLLSFSLTFVIVTEPTQMTCGLRRFGIGFCFCLCYSALLTKTNRLARIMTVKDSEGVKRSPRFITPQSQLVIVFGILFVQVAMLVLGLYLEPPSIKPSKTTSEMQDAIFNVCFVPHYDLIVTYSYNVLLILICTVYAFKTRKVPRNFNEAKYIGFVMYTTCVIWVAFVPVYTVGINDEYNTVAVCMNITLSATSILAGLFVPKLYIIIFRPDRNRRSKSVQSLENFSQSLESDDKGGVARKMTSASTNTAMSVTASPVDRFCSFDEDSQFYNLSGVSSRVRPL